jgi:archaellin
VVIDLTELAIDGVDPAVSAVNRPNLYAHTYEEFRVELRPSQGAVLTIDKLVPAVYSTVIVIE